MTNLQLSALTICQPYAHLIATPQAELPVGWVAKRVENRRWFTPHRGPLAIHAGKSRAWMGPGDEIPELVFGAVIAIAELVTCVRHKPGQHTGTLAWLNDHVHAEGPWCWVLADVRRLRRPFPVRGERGVFTVSIPDDYLPES